MTHDSATCKECSAIQWEADEDKGTTRLLIHWGQLLEQAELRSRTRNAVGVPYSSATASGRCVSRRRLSSSTSSLPSSW